MGVLGTKRERGIDMVANDIRMNVDMLAFKCHVQGIYAVESEMKKRTIYICDNGELAIVRNNSLLRLAVDEVPAFIEELKGIYEDYDFRESGQLKLKKRAKPKRRTTKTVQKI